MKKNILILSDTTDTNTLKKLYSALTEQTVECNIEAVYDPGTSEALHYVRQYRADLVIVNLVPPRAEAVIEAIKKENSEIFIIYSLGSHCLINTSYYYSSDGEIGLGDGSYDLLYGDGYGCRDDVLNDLAKWVSDYMISDGHLRDITNLQYAYYLPKNK